METLYKLPNGDYIRLSDVRNIHQTAYREVGDMVFKSAVLVNLDQGGQSHIECVDNEEMRRVADMLADAVNQFIGSEKPPLP